MKDEKDRIKEVQTLIKRLGLEDHPDFKEVVEIDTESEDRLAEHEYWSNLEGKHLIKEQNGNIKLVTISKVTCHNKYTWGGNWCSVVVDRIYFDTRKDAIGTYKELNHILCGTKPGRYSDYKVISEEDYNTIIRELDKLIDTANKMRQNIHDTFCI